MTDKTNQHRKSTEGIFKKYRHSRQLKTEADDATLKRSANTSMTYRLRLSPQTLAQTSTGRIVQDRSIKKVGFQQTTEQKAYDRIKTDNLVYENSLRKINSENQDLI